MATGYFQRDIYIDSGDLAEITDWTGGDPIEFDFTAARQIEEIRRPNGVTSHYGYDAALRLTGITHEDAGTSTALAEFGYEYDANSNRTRLDVTGTEVANGYELYGYDELNRLDYVRYPYASEVEYTYDLNGNLTTIAPVGGSATMYGYDDADQMQTVNSVQASLKVQENCSRSFNNKCARRRQRIARGNQAKATAYLTLILWRLAQRGNRDGSRKSANRLGIVTRSYAPYSVVTMFPL